MASRFYRIPNFSLSMSVAALVLFWSSYYFFFLISCFHLIFLFSYWYLILDFFRLRFFNRECGKTLSSFFNFSEQKFLPSFIYCYELSLCVKFSVKFSVNMNTLLFECFNYKIFNLKEAMLTNRSLFCTRAGNDYMKINN